MDELKDYREKIDDVDGELARLLFTRFNYVCAIGALKEKQNLHLVDIEREIDVMDRVLSISEEFPKDDLILDAVEKIYFSIISMSRRLQ